MSAGKHYFIEQRDDGCFAIQAKRPSRASAVVNTQREAEKLVKQFNPEDHPT